MPNIPRPVPPKPKIAAQNIFVGMSLGHSYKRQDAQMMDIDKMEKKGIKRKPSCKKND